MKVVRASIALGLFVVAVHLSCGTTGNHCEVDTDCPYGPNSLPGGVCIDNVCQCAPGNVECCISPLYPGFCDRACAPCDKCHPAARPTACPPTECITEDECAQPDPLCGFTNCEWGKCVRYVTDGPLDMPQRRGDCKLQQASCLDGILSTVIASDPFDTEDDGNPCTVDTCNALTAAHSLAAVGTSCEYQGKMGVCYDGRCVDCIEAWPMGVSPYGDAFCAAAGKGGFCGGYCCSPVSTQDCPLPPMPQPAQCPDPGTAPWAGACVPEHCVNEIKDADESSVDCGGSCLPCP